MLRRLDTRIAKILQSMLRSFKHGSYRQQVAILVSGTAAAQVLPIAASPILTRLYEPEDFGVLAIFASVASILISVSSAQYDQAITLPEKDEDAATIVSLCIRICGIFSLLLLLLVLLFNHTLAQWIGHPEIASWLYLIPFSVFASGLFSTFTFWCNRRAAYGHIAKQTFQLSAVTVTSSIALGFASIAGGQIIGVTLGRISSAFCMMRVVYKTDKKILILGFRTKVLPLAKRYIAHPTYFTPSRLINTFALQIPVLMISNLFLISTVGFFSIAYKLVALPTSIIANAIGNVYRQKISESYNEHGHYRHIYKRTLLITILASIIPFTALYLFAPFLFAVVFGEEWRVAGDYAQILVVSTFFSFITTPLNKGAIVVGAKRYDLAWNIGRFSCFSALWLLGYSFKLSIDVVLWIFVCANICLYLIDAVYQYKLSGGSSNNPNPA